jgi:hypothetical protein
MKRALAFLAFFTIGTLGSAWAQAPAGSPTEVKCKDGTTSTAGPGACSHHGGVAKDAAGGAPGAAAQVRCKDGTSANAGPGACSHHGGVDKTAQTNPAPSAPGRERGAEPARAEPAPSTPKPAAGTAPASKTAPAPAGASPTAKCKDGTMSFAKHHSGACSNHGGVAEWLDGSAPH